MDDFNNSDNSGMVGFLVGIIVLVFAGIVFSLMADKRFRFSSNKISLEERIAEEHHDLETCKIRLETARQHWRENCEPLAAQGNSIQSASAGVKAGEARVAALRQEKETAVAGLSAATLALEEYRNRYRQQVRGAAAGEQIPELKSRSGRIYKDVTIRKVSVAGMEIRHDQGISRLLPEDLDPAWHERFQWNRDEVIKMLDEEKARQDRHNQLMEDSKDDDPDPVPVVKPSKPGKTKEKEPDPAEAKIQSIREEVLEARNRYRNAQSEAMRARSEASNSARGRSVPGSLETWGDRASRLESATVKLRSQYMAARGKLATLAPRDALLMTDEQQ
ncbi:hypothetical protein [Luteolibacter sp. Populi]|uniref:hypothetical protein n=1 Tax=Luteolibacter sp. Populi TaxID=3230487 RepID=UPI003465F118